MRKILVLGSNSFSGQNMIDLLLDNPDNIIAGVSRSPEKDKLFLGYKTRSNLSNYRFYQMDMNNSMDSLLALIEAEQPEYIINFAAQSEVGPSWDTPEQWFATNCVALAKMINVLRKSNYLKKYIHISSPEVYGNCSGFVNEDYPMNPSTPYAASKASADMLLSAYFRQFGFPVVTVRSTNVYGARQQIHKIIPRTIIFLKMGKKLNLHGGGAAVKSYIHIRDISQGELAILEKGEQGRIYHLAPYRGISIRDLVKKICSITGNDFKKCVADAPERPGQDSIYTIDSTKARNLLGWSDSIPLEDGIKETICWIEENWETIKVLPTEYQHKP